MVVFFEFGCSEEVFESIFISCVKFRGLLFNFNEFFMWIDVGIYEINEDGFGF